MQREHQNTYYYQGNVYRSLTALMGVLLLGVGIWAAFFTDASLMNRLVAFLIFGTVGANALIAALASKESWISKIGPLP